MRGLAPLGLMCCGLLMGCADEPGARDDRPLTRNGGTFVQNGVCVAQTRSGQLVRVSPGNCPSLRQQQDQGAQPLENMQ